MNTIYENISRLCEQYGITGAKMCNDIGIGKSLMTSLKSGRTKSINAKTAVKIAEYFDVPVGAITGGEGYTRISSRNGVVKVDAYHPPKAKVAAMSAQYDAIRLDQTEKAAPVSESGLDAEDIEILKLFSNAPDWKRKAALALLRAAEDGE